MDFLRKISTTKQKNSYDYAIVHFDCDDGMMLYGIPKTVKFCNGEYLGNKTWVLINDGGLSTEVFQNKVKEYVKKFENKGHKVTITFK